MPRFLTGFIPALPHAGPGQFSAVNGVRGLGSVMIAMAHLWALTDFIFVDYTYAMFPLVDLFFVFSGVIMFYAYGEKLSGGGSKIVFFTRRIGRLWPLQAATLAILVAWEGCKWALVATGKASPQEMPFSGAGMNAPQAILPNLLLLNAIGLTARDTWNFPSWSLGAESVAYVFFAFAVAISPRDRRIICSLTALACLTFLTVYAPSGMRSSFDFGALRCLGDFCIGVLLYDLVLSKPIPHWPAPTVVEFGVLCFAGWFASISVYRVWACLTPFVLACVVIVFTAERGRLSRIFSTRPFQILAEWSYSIYMVHALVLIVVVSGLRAWGRASGISTFKPGAGEVVAGVWTRTEDVIALGSPGLAILLVILYLAGVVGLSACTYRFIETPGRRLFNGLARYASGARPRVRASA